MTLPQTRYASLGGADIAYQVLGEGPLDLVYANGLTEHIDVQWEHPLMARFLQRLASFSRLVMFDRRGAGASDPVPLDALPTWEEWTDDLRAVMDAVGSQRAAVYAELDAGPVGMIFAATHPERTSALVLGNTVTRYARTTTPCVAGRSGGGSQSSARGRSAPTSSTTPSTQAFFTCKGRVRQGLPPGQGRRLDDCQHQHGEDGDQRHPPDHSAHGSSSPRNRYAWTRKA